MPLELLTMLISTVVGGIISLMSQSSKNKKEQHEQMVSALAQRQEGFNQAREYGKKDKAFSFTRRVIAISAIAAIVVLPKVAALFWPDMPIFYGYPEEVTEGWWIFATSLDAIKWKQMVGLVITPLDSHLVSAIVGLYFGAASARH